MLPWGGVGLCLGGAALYCLGRNSGRDAAILKSVKRVSQLRDLALLMDTTCEAPTLVVNVAGRVGSEVSISCEHSSLRGVILEETEEQHFLKYNGVDCWIPDSALVLSTRKEVPWYLEDGTGRVFVVGARSAMGLKLTVASEVFEESGQSLVRYMPDYLRGLEVLGRLKMRGVKRVERVLPTGIALTVVGEAVKDDVGTIRIQKPHNGPYYVSPTSTDQLIANLWKWARWYKFASLGFTLFGVYLMASHAVRHVMEFRRQRRALQRRGLEAAAQRLEQKEHERDQSETGIQLHHDVRRDNSIIDLCVVCLGREYNTVFVPATDVVICAAVHHALHTYEIVHYAGDVSNNLSGPIVSDILQCSQHECWFTSIWILQSFLKGLHADLYSLVNTQLVSWAKCQLASQNGCFPGFI